MSEEEVRKAAGLWKEYLRIKLALLQDGFIRSYKAPEADFAEWLANVIFKGKLSENKSQANFDIITDDKRIQVKSISKMPSNKNGYAITDKDRQNNPESGATHYAFIFFKKLVPDAIFLVTAEFVKNSKKKQITRRDLENNNSKVEFDFSLFG